MEEEPSEANNNVIEFGDSPQNTEPRKAGGSAEIRGEEAEPRVDIERSTSHLVARPVASAAVFLQAAVSSPCCL